MSGDDPTSGREQTVYGRKSCWAVFTHRPEDILRVFHGQERRQELAALLKWAAAVRIPYRELDEEGLRRVSGATHHEGLVMAVRPLDYAADPGGLPEADEIWMALDRVDNPYNLGAILRTCAFFGVGTVLVGGAAPGSKVNGAVLRAAEGGAESLRLVACPAPAGLAPLLRDLALRGVTVVGLESDAPLALGSRPLGRPAVLVVGHEQEGLSADVRAACSLVCAIPGRGEVSSLNVSVSAGIALADLLAEDAPGATGSEAALQRSAASRPRPRDRAKPASRLARQTPKPGRRR